MLANIVVGFVIVSLLTLAAMKLTKDKKDGNTCGGCPYSGDCSSCSSESDYEPK